MWLSNLKAGVLSKDSAPCSFTSLHSLMQGNAAESHHADDGSAAAHRSGSEAEDEKEKDSRKGLRGVYQDFIKEATQEIKADHPFLTPKEALTRARKLFIPQILNCKL